MILLTGASGFIGRHLLKALVEEYGVNYVIALTSYPISDCQYLLHQNYTFDEDFFINNGYNNVKTIIHAGAFTPKNSLESNDWQNSYNNIKNTTALLKAINPGLERIIYLSTLDVYDSAEILSEDSPVSPISLYADSKLYCEKIITAWAKQNGKLSQILRVGHVYGPGEEAYHKIIPVTIKKLLKNESLQIFGAGDDIRSFINIGDIISSILESLKLTEDIGPVNLVSANQITIKELINKIIKLSGKIPVVENVATDFAPRNLIFDNKKMNKYLLKNEIDFDEGLKEEWEYMKKRY